MTELFPNRCPLPAPIIVGYGLGGVHGKILHISPAKVGANAQNQSKDARSKWSGSRSSAMTC
jgi:hypothetical protein